MREVREVGTHPPNRSPRGKNAHKVLALRNVVKMHASCPQQRPAKALNGSVFDALARERQRLKRRDSLGKLLREQIRRRGPMLTPPSVNGADLALRLGRDEHRRGAHRRNKSASTSRMGRPCPAVMEVCA